VLVTSDGAINLTETKRTLFGSTLSLDSYGYSDGSLFLKLNGNLLTGLAATITNIYHTPSSFKAAEHVFTGEGMPTIVVDEKNYNINNPTSIFSAIKTQQNKPAGQLSVCATVSTQFGQLSTDGEHQQYKVHLNAGQSYVFP